MATLSALQEKILADSTAMFRVQSDLFNAVYNQSAGSANTIQFMSTGVPSAATPQANELDNVTPTAVTVSAVDATLKTYPILATVSNLAIASPNAAMKIATALAGGLARTTDTIISALFGGFSTVVGDASTDISVSDFFAAIAKLDESGFVGEKVAVFHPQSWKKIGSGILALAGANQTSEQFLTRGYIATVGGCEIYVSPWVDKTLSYQNGIYFKEALGFGYREPIVEIDSMPNLSKVGVDILGVSYMVAKELTDAAGVCLKDKLVA